MSSDPFRETNLIQLFANHQHAQGIGDDAAIIQHQDTTITVSQDTLNEDIHFDLKFCSPQTVAHRSLCANLSDMAAMGLNGHYVLQSLSLPIHVDDTWVSSYAQTFMGLCKEHQLMLIGGDTCRNPHTLSITISIMDIRPTIQPLTRAGAKPGDTLFISKPLGLSHLGLIAKQSGHSIPNSIANAYLRPTPEITLGSQLLKTKCVHACMDVTDGLKQDVQKLCDINHLDAHIELDAIPEHDAYQALCTTLALNPNIVKATGGEDYALLIAGPEYLPQKIDHTIHPIGVLKPCQNTPSVHWSKSGKSVKIQAIGFTHF